MYHFHLTIRLPSHEWITRDYVTWLVYFFDQRSLSYPPWLYCTVVLPKCKALQQLCLILKQRISPDWREWSLNETDSTQARKNLFRLLNNNTVELDHDLCEACIQSTRNTSVNTYQLRLELSNITAELKFVVCCLFSSYLNCFFPSHFHKHIIFIIARHNTVLILTSQSNQSNLSIFTLRSENKFKFCLPTSIKRLIFRRICWWVERGHSVGVIAKPTKARYSSRFAMLSCNSYEDNQSGVVSHRISSLVKINIAV